jgi:hypothetical protein
MDQKHLQASHIHISSFKGDVQSKLSELDKLIQVVGNSPAPSKASGHELILLSKLRNMMNVLNLHTTSILNDLSELKIADSAYRESNHTKDVAEFIDQIINVVAPHTQFIYLETVSKVSEIYKESISDYNAKMHASENEQSKDNAYNNPYYMNLNRH